jgi:hypothetical protein
LSTNAPGTLTVTLGTPAGNGGQVVNLIILDPTVASSTQPSVTIPQGSTTATFTINPLNIGSTGVYGTGSGYRAGITSISVSQAGIQLSLSSTNVGITKSVTGTISLNAPAPAGLTVSLGTDKSGIVSLPPTVSIGAGLSSGTFTVTGLAAGSVNITGSASGYASSPAASLTVGALGTITLQSGVTVSVGQSVSLGVSLFTPAPVGGVTIALVSSDTTTLTVTPSVFIPAGGTSTTAQVIGVAAGQATVTASAPGFSGGSTALPVTIGLGFTPQNLTMSAHSSQFVTLSLSAPAGPLGVAINFSSNNTNVANIPLSPPSVLIPQGSQAAIIPINAVSVGAANITASSTTPGVASGILTVTVISGVAITTTALPNGIAGAAYNGGTGLQVSASGGTAPYKFSATGLPAGLTISQGGLISGTPGANTAGTGAVNLTVTDSSTLTPLIGTINLSLTINPAVSVSTTSLPNGGLGASYGPVQINATGGSGSYSFAATGLPANLAMSTAGVISGTPNAAGPNTVNITVTDTTTHQTGSANLSLTVYAGLAITNTSLPIGVVGVSYGPVQINATGGSGSYTFSVTGQPANLTMSAAGSISGTPNAAGPNTLNLTVTDASTHVTASAVLSLPVYATPAIANTALPNGQVGASYGPVQINATGGSGSYSFTATGLPASLTMSTAGAISGSPNAAGPNTVTITVTDTLTHQTATASLSLSVLAGLAITNTSLPNGYAGLAYGPVQVSAAGGSGSYSFTATGLPANLTMSAAGTITGTPTAAGGSTVNITVTDAGTHQTGSANLSLTIGPAVSITTSSLPIGVVGVAYGPAQVNATGGTGSFSFTATGLPANLTMSTSGAISGTPNTVGGTNVSITVTDTTTHQTASTSLSLTINPAVSIITGSLPSGFAGVAYGPVQVNASGGSGSFSFTATGLPANLTITTSGVIAGTPTAASSGTVNITVTDTTTHQTASVGLSLSISTGLAISNTSLSSGTVGVAYGPVQVSATGGSGSYSFAATGLPANLTMNTGGLITGTPTATSSGTVTITVTDTITHQTATAGLSLQVFAALGISTVSLPNGIAGFAYGPVQVSAAGGSGSYSFGATGLPANLTMSTGGAISGTPGAAGGSTVNITVTDTTTHRTASTSLTLTINPAVSITTTSLATGFAGAAYGPVQVSASGGSGSYSFAATGLPANLTMSTSGLIAGTPTAGSSGTVSITVTDTTTHQTANAGLSLQVFAGLGITTVSLPNGVAGFAYGPVQVNAIGGSGSYSFAATGLPSNLTMSVSGAISGTPAGAGSSTVNITVTDTSTHQTASASLPLIINPAVSITTTSLPGGIAQVVYGPVQVSATGGSGSYSFAATGLPVNLTMSTGGAISGTPNAAGASTVNITVTDTITHQTASASLSLTINPAVSITTTSLPSGIAGTSYGPVQVNATGGSGSYSFAATGLPSNLTMSASGAISGTPSSVGGSTVNITVTDATTHQTASASLSLTINAAVTITTTSLPGGIAGAAYGPVQVNATGGSGSYSFAATGLPSNLTMSASGAISGTPGAAGGSTVNITVTDTTTHQTASTSLSLTINPAVSMTTTSLPNGIAQVVYGPVQVHATGGSGSYSFAATGLPANLTMSAGGAISGTPSAAGSSTVSITVTDTSTHQTAITNLSLTINPAVSITSTSLAVGIVGAAYGPVRVNATGGSGMYSFSATGLPSNLTMSTAGTISGTPAAAGSTSVTVTVTDTTTQQTASFTFSLTINPAVSITTTSLPSGTVGTPYSVQVFATGGSGSYTFSGSNIPSGLGINISGALAGTPLGAGAAIIAVTVKDTVTQQTASANLSILITPSAGPSFIITGGTVGFGLQQLLNVTVSPAPTAPLIVTIQSSNPGLVSVAGRATDTGTGLITFRVDPGTTTFSVYAQGGASSGSATITISASGYINGNSTVTLAPSAFVVDGGNGPGASIITAEGAVTNVTVTPYFLNSGVPSQPQAVAGGTTALVSLAVGNSTYGSASPLSLSFSGANTSQTSHFTAGLTAGSTSITLTEPTGFTAPSDNSNAIAVTVQPNGVIAGSLTVGYQLEDTTQVTLQGAATSNTTATITSNDPTKLLLSTDGVSAGQSSITLTIKAGFNRTPPFYVYALVNSGSATYTATVPGFGAANGTVNFAPSGFVLSGPFGLGADFSTTTGSPLSANGLEVQSYRLDSSGNINALEAVAGGLSVNVNITSSQPAIGTISGSPAVFSGGVSDVTAFFQPLTDGTTLLSASASGFTTPAAGASLNAIVTTPRITLNSTSVGFNLQQASQFFLGAPAPSAGVTVAFTASGSLLLSTTGTDAGSTSITVTIGADGQSGLFYIYGGASSGTGTISATAPGYLSGSATITLTASGVIISGPGGPGSSLTTTVAAGNQPVTISTAQLDSSGSYIQMQPLAGSAFLTISLSNSNPATGTVPSTATILRGSASTNVNFTPLEGGGQTTVISVGTPSGGYITPNKDTSLIVLVN